MGLRIGEGTVSYPKQRKVIEGVFNDDKKNKVSGIGKIVKQDRWV